MTMVKQKSNARSRTQEIDDALAALQRLSESFGLRREQLARSAGITEAQWRVLEEISTEHFMPSLFARNRNCSAAAVSKVLRQLLDMDLIEVSIASRDARQRDYQLSSTGRRTMKRLRGERQRAIDDIWSDLDPRELQRFSRFSRELAGRLEEYAARE